MGFKYSDTINTTNTLKGIAITSVIINHYLNLNISGDSTGFAYLFVSIFFMLSGFGLFHSLERRLGSNGFSFRDLLVFYYDRSVRIFPLLWIAWFVQMVVNSGNMSFWILFGIHGDDHYWFIPALLQCYLLSPFIYLGIKKKPMLTFLIILALVIITNILFSGGHVPRTFIKSVNFVNGKYSSYFFLHIIIFTFGLFAAYLMRPEKKNERKASNKIGTSLFWGLLLLILFIMIILKYISINYPMYRIVFMIGPLIMHAFLCIYALRYFVKSAVFIFMGRISYSIYLFHMTFFLLLDDLGNFPDNSYKEFLLFTILFPAFIYFCYQIEKIGKYISRKLDFFNK